MREEGYEHPTPIQQQAIPFVLAGRDLLGLAQTGTGKTAAFALPILQRLTMSEARPQGVRPIRVLILTPTRELASQIGESFAVYGRHLGYRHAVIFGGVGQAPQERQLRAGLDILIATPGRLLDLCSQRLVQFSGLEVFVLDEADRMLDMGFIHDVKRVIKLLPQKRQTLFFSATMPRDAADLAAAILNDPAQVAVAPVSATADRIEQSVYFVEKSDKRLLLSDLLRDGVMTRALVFSRTKHGANRVADYLSDRGIVAQAIHGNKSQNARERALAGFKTGAVRVLVATDIAARGIDIEEISHVINYDLPNIPETYVHRIGRTARAGAAGIALSFCEAEERPFLADIERLIRKQIPVIGDHAYRSSLPPPSANAHHGPPGREQGSRGPAPAQRRGNHHGSPAPHRADNRAPHRPAQLREARPEARPEPRAAAAAQPSRPAERPADTAQTTRPRRRTFSPRPR